MTLIELLVVIVIIVILITMTVMAVNFSFDSDRTRGAARQVQSYLEGARDRAIYAKEPRGVRFLVDENNGRTVTSMIFVGPPEKWSDGIIRLERFTVANDDTADAPFRVNVVHGVGTGWSDLVQRGLLVDGARIKIPGDNNGSWYTVTVPNPNNPAHGWYPNPSQPNHDYLFLTLDYRDPGTTDETEVPAFRGSSGPRTYLLELPPAPLPNQEPQLLPGNIVIDLDGSNVPGSWRTPASISAGDSSLHQRAGGSLIRYSSRMDIMFTPRGTVMGEAASSGLIHLYVAEPADVDRMELLRLNLYQTNGGPFAVVPADQVGNPPEPVGERVLVTIFTQTGNISTHEINPNDSDPSTSIGYQIADDPFYYAEVGEVAGK